MATAVFSIISAAESPQYSAVAAFLPSLFCTWRCRKMFAPVKPKLSSALRSQPDSYQVFIKATQRPLSLAGRSDTPGRNTIFCSLAASQCTLEHALAFWLGTKWGQPAAAASCGSETVLQVLFGDLFGQLQSMSKGKKKGCLQASMS